jgi:hypothetical protein
VTARQRLNYDLTVELQMRKTFGPFELLALTSKQIFTNEMVLVEGRKPFGVIRVVSPLDRSLSIFLITGLNIFICAVFFENALKHTFSLLF